VKACSCALQSIRYRCSTRVVTDLDRPLVESGYSFRVCHASEYPSIAFGIPLCR
jgi:hypothetical protein